MEGRSPQGAAPFFFCATVFSHSPSERVRGWHACASLNQRRLGRPVRSTFSRSQPSWACASSGCGSASAVVSGSAVASLYHLQRSFIHSTCASSATPTLRSTPHIRSPPAVRRGEAILLDGLEAYRKRAVSPTRFRFRPDPNSSADAGPGDERRNFHRFRMFRAGRFGSLEMRWRSRQTTQRSGST